VQQVDREVADTGALNTISFANGQMRGSNTDVGAVRSALEFVKVRGSLRGQRGCVLGTGGAARAALMALLYEGAEVRLMGRSRDRIKDFARERHIEFARLSSELISQWAPAVVVHCTPVGTTPDVTQSLLPDWKIEPETVVMDLVYNPAETALLQRARRSGARTVSGLMVFLMQATAQLELWTGEQLEPTSLLNYCGPSAGTLSGFMT
jgi:shikimate dehydrogenase